MELLWANHWVQEQRKTRNGKKQYSLWDCYAIADLVTYPSVLEGWGNQLLEAIFAKLPVVLYEYPVYQRDLIRFGFDVGSFGSSHQRTETGYVTIPWEQMEQAGKAALRYLTDGQARVRAVQRNYDVASTRLSYPALAELVIPLFQKAPENEK